jgi:hypothetical protein
MAVALELVRESREIYRYQLSRKDEANSIDLHLKRSAANPGSHPALNATPFPTSPDSRFPSRSAFSRIKSAYRRRTARFLS